MFPHTVTFMLLLFCEGYVSEVVYRLKWAVVLPGAACLYIATFILFIIYPGERIAALSQTLCDQYDSFALKYSYSFRWKQIPLCADVFVFVCIRPRERTREWQRERDHVCLNSKYSYFI